MIWGHSGLPTVIKASSGVTIFFFLSGYLITTLLRVEGDRFGKISIRDFFLRRVFRIFPPLYVVLLIAVVLTLGGLLAAEMTGLGLFSTAAFWANYYIIFEGREGLPGAMNALWSLAVEEHFYLMFPLLYIGMRRWLPGRWQQTGLLVTICMAIMVWRIVLWNSGASWDRIYLATDTRADAILWGSVMALGFNPLYGEVRAPRRKWIMPAILFASAAAFYIVVNRVDSGSWFVSYTVQSLLLFGIFIPLIAAADSWPGKVMNWRPLAYIGIISYTLYLIHRPMLELAETWLPVPLAVQAIVAVAASFLFAWGMKRVVEDPSARARKRLNRAGESENTGANDDAPLAVDDASQGGASERR